MAGITDAERDILNRLLADDVSDMTVDDLLRLPAGAVSMFRLLAECWQALGEIAEKEPYEERRGIGPFYNCSHCEAMIEIARNARKGGSNG